MRVDVLTLFPSMFDGPLDESIIKRARQAGHLDLRITDIRDFAHDAHKTVDDRPFGGGPGMVLKPEPMFEAVASVRTEKSRVVMLAPVGRLYNQTVARSLAKCEHLVLLCGSYEGFDERIREALVDEVVSIGDYVLTNGALPEIGRAHV